MSRSGETGSQRWDGGKAGDQRGGNREGYHGTFRKDRLTGYK